MVFSRTQLNEEDIGLTHVWANHPEFVDVFTQNAIQAQLNDLGSRQATLYLPPSAWTVSATLVIPPNIMLWVPDGCTIGGAGTLTIGLLMATLRTGWYTGTGTLTVTRWIYDGQPQTAVGNPTQQIGLTAINGTASTAMRSDAAPALSQAITPTWTGKHVWQVTPSYDLAGPTALGQVVALAPGALSGSPLAHVVAGYAHVAMVSISQATNDYSNFVVGDYGTVSGISSVMRMDAASGAYGAVYATVLSTSNAGAGATKAAHIAAFGENVATQTGACVAVAAQIAPSTYATPGQSTCVQCVVGPSPLARDVASFVTMLHYSGARMQYGIANTVAPMSIQIAAYQAYIDMDDSAGAARFLSLRQSKPADSVIHGAEPFAVQTNGMVLTDVVDRLPDTLDLNHGGALLKYRLEANSGVSHLVSRNLVVQSRNALSGGGHMQTLRGVSSVMVSDANSATDTWAAFYCDVTTNAGTVANAIGLYIGNLPSTPGSPPPVPTVKWGILDGSGGNWSLHGGLSVASVGDTIMGPGTINTGGNIYLNGSIYNHPDYVFEHAATGTIVQHADKDGAAEYHGLQPLAEIMTYAKTHYQLPRIAEARARGNGHLGVFDGGDAMLASLEEAYLYIEQLEGRVHNLEAAVFGPVAS